MASGAIASSSNGATGWCTGQGGMIANRKCALDQCAAQADANDSCSIALECSSGWGAIAYGRDKGFAAVCEGNNEATTRAVALVSCIRASGGICDVTDTFGSNGFKAAQSDNMAFGEVYMTQFALSDLNYYSGPIDGLPGRATTAAILKYQQSTPGVPVSGNADETLLTNLIAAEGGQAKFVELITRTTDGLIKPEQWNVKAWSGDEAGGGQKQSDQRQADNGGSGSGASVPSDFSVAQADLAARFSDSFSRPGNYTAATQFNCAQEQNGPYVCSAQAAAKDRVGAARLALEIYAGDGTAQAKARAEALAREAGKGGSLVRTSNTIKSESKSGGEARNYDIACVQTLGQGNSRAICYLALTPRAVITASLPPAQAATPVITDKVPDIDATETLVLAAVASLEDLPLPK